MVARTDDKIQVCLVSVIVTQGYGDRVGAYIRSKGHPVVETMRGRGTVGTDLLAELGLKDNHKDVLIALMPENAAHEFMEHIEMLFAMPGIGIAFYMKLSSVGGRKTYAYITRGQSGPGKEEAPEVERENTHELVMAVINRGFTDLVMDAARGAGARGGTILHARGTGAEEAAAYFGVSIQPEKEIVLIICQKDQKNDIMTAVMKNAGTATPAGGIVFSLPVDEVAGLDHGKGANGNGK